ncbi:hypothetical protein IGK80_002838 [Enterococcus sp. DIV0609]|jgi:hypothetical protein|nr:hypothetical protein [Enterococcus faecalis]MDN3095759.1 hypothetical protein [Enterococcus faecalis]MDN3201759.1 hypothetical protein [Enterococcus faecalis]MDT2096112.1 hypothetical protein [Enterococcus faecalis]
MDKKSSLREKYKSSVKQRKEELLIGLRPQDKKAVKNIKYKK